MSAQKRRCCDCWHEKSSFYPDFYRVW